MALGDAVAIVAAHSPEIAREALEQICVEYEDLPVVASAEDARRRMAAVLPEPDRGAEDALDVALVDIDRALPIPGLLVQFARH